MKRLALATALVLSSLALPSLAALPASAATKPVAIPAALQVDIKAFNDSYTATSGDLAAANKAFVAGPVTDLIYITGKGYGVGIKGLAIYYYEFANKDGASFCAGPVAVNGRLVSVALPTKCDSMISRSAKAAVSAAGYTAKVRWANELMASLPAGPLTLAAIQTALNTKIATEPGLYATKLRNGFDIKTRYVTTPVVKLRYTNANTVAIS